MNVAPFVPGHRPEVFYVLSAAALVEKPAPAACAGRQYVFHNKAGKSQTQQVDQADQIDNKI